MTRLYTEQDIAEEAKAYDKWKEEERERALNLNLVLLYAKDIVEAWPHMTIRTTQEMTSKVNTLKQALEAFLTMK